jgi:hypothetical protein
MKSLQHLLSFLLVCMAIPVRAQNWAPVNPYESFNYKKGNDPLVTVTIRKDSVRLSGTDSIYYLNRLMCDSCDAVHSGYGLKNQPSFLMRTAIHRANGTWNLLGPGNIAIPTSLPVGTSWLYDSINGISARVTFVGVAGFFGGVDSVMKFLLSTNDTVILSKNFGILRYPAAPAANSYYNLVGIEGRNAGIRVPGMKQIYDMNVGDMFEYHSYIDNTFFYNFYSWSFIDKYTIIQKTIKGDSLIYAVQGLEREDDQYPGAGHATTYRVINTNKTYVDSLKHFANSYRGEGRVMQKDKSSSFNFPTEYNYMRFYTDTSGLFTKEVGFASLGQDMLSFCMVSLNGSDTLAPVSIPLGYGASSTYRTGLGQTDYVYSEDQHVVDYHLVAWEKSGVSSGVFTPDSLLKAPAPLGIQSFAFPPFTFTLSPNPAQDHIRVNMSSQQEGVASITDLQGKILQRSYFKGPQLDFETTTLQAGLYLVKIQTEAHLLVRKFVVIR